MGRNIHTKKKCQQKLTDINSKCTSKLQLLILVLFLTTYHISELRGFFYSKMTKTTCVTQCTKNKMSKCEKKKPFVSEMKKDVSIKAHTP